MITKNQIDIETQKQHETMVAKERSEFSKAWPKIYQELTLWDDLENIPFQALQQAAWTVWLVAKGVKS